MPTAEDYAIQVHCELHRTDRDANIKALTRAFQQAINLEREACAKVPEAKAQDYLSPQYATGQPLSSHAERFACKQIAEAIRARQ